MCTSVVAGHPDRHNASVQWRDGAPWQALRGERAGLGIGVCPEGRGRITLLN